MTDAQMVERWIDRFPLMRALSPAHLQLARGTVQFPVLETGATAYELDGECANYLMCLDGRTRVFRMSEAGREVLIYKVGPGGTCALTTQCLLSGGTFPAESVAEERTQLAALPVGTFQHLMDDSAAFRSFVMDDYTRLMSGLFTLIDAVAFAPLKQRLAQRILAEADPRGVAMVTHQTLADDVGSVREVVSRILAQWAEAGLIELRRGAIEVVDRASLAAAARR
ncbi:MULTISPECIES: Crp/Fnr family transcriptional regulator [unclassified Methylobacterium]|uniref:Crp/Fnr family transcriptional regulator n=1 Tax=unclassified Methylobacterium TaxID=2615210 RepID=UPI0011C1E44F|nr:MULTISPECIES: Crp/Fnr family transcriptional regulator [unclassified Methylobacterium]QEE38313.1 Crp/Fnr family transcriptional regulator [Methylobacterium sp. WL1]TXN57474.1 Crp/Fnr family transcriptional regulator [Methylobacterium sp. WL2]